MFPRPITRVFLLFSLWFFGLTEPTHSEWSDSEKISFNRDIRPILADNCFACHGPDSHNRAADLRLDDRESAIAAGAISVGKPEESELVRRIFASDPDEIMPTPASHKSLSDQQKSLLKTWIQQGAEYQDHWAFDPISLPELPSVNKKSWVLNPIDCFTLSELEKRGLEPSPEADLRSLIRRVCLDLTGLPPTVQEVHKVLSDSSPNRYENYVDELLNRPQWGEHRGRYWLDYARYADTHGIHFDNFREMWSYREWVVSAFNRNMPFDRFTIEQLAGDLLPEPNLDQLIATGFNRCNPTTNEGGIIDEEYDVLYTRDRVETVSQVWLGLTMGCAVCHDHKFDPISQKDFYAMAAFFNNTTQATRDGNVKDTPPIVQVPVAEDRNRYMEVEAKISQLTQKMADRRQAASSQFTSWLASLSEDDKNRWGELPAQEMLETHVPLAEPAGTEIEVTQREKTCRIPIDGTSKSVPGYTADHAWKIDDLYPSIPAGDFERNQAFSVSLWVSPGNDSQGGALVARLDESNDYRGWDVWTESGAIAMHLIHKWPDNAIKAVSRRKLKAGQWSHVAITYDGSSSVEGIKIFLDGEEAETTQPAKSLTDTIRTSVPLTIGSRTPSSPARSARIQDIRIYSEALPPEHLRMIGETPRRNYLLSRASLDRKQTDELLDWYLKNHDEQFPQLNATIKALVAEKTEIQRRGTIAHVMHESDEPAKAYILMRGEYDKRTTEVAPETPTALPPMTEELPRNRLGFAKWLIQEDNPLTARVTVNRFWQEVFGTGLVPTSGDFGISGQLPTHPELLDYLAASFRQSGWNVKDLFRSMVTSATYRQSSIAQPEEFEADPTNQLLSRGPRFRMDAEMVRDYAMATSGLLVPKIGGPSVRPYQPPGVWEAVAIPGSNTREYVADTGEGLYRRSIYTFIKRSAPPPNMDAFNATTREVCTIKRERTNTPLQALVTLNDVQFVEAARVLAARILADEDLMESPFINTTEMRIQAIGSRLIARPFRPEELKVIASGLERLLNHYANEPDQAELLILQGQSQIGKSLDKTELAAWTMVVNALMNLDEVLNK